MIRAAPAYGLTGTRPPHDRGRFINTSGRRDINFGGKLDFRRVFLEIY